MSERLGKSRNVLFRVALGGLDHQGSTGIPARRRLMECQGRELSKAWMGVGDAQYPAAVPGHGWSIECPPQPHITDA